jgi:hypothetical protein
VQRWRANAISNIAIANKQFGDPKAGGVEKGGKKKYFPKKNKDISIPATGSLYFVRSLQHYYI